MPSPFHTRLLLTCALSFLCMSSAQAFTLNDPNLQPWLSSASGSRSGNGEPITLTWSIVADGTSTPNEDNTRIGGNLISFLDMTFGGAPGTSSPSDLTARPWFDLFAQTFDRWEALSGIDYLYEPNDDGESLGFFPGQLGIRGDIRLSGRDIDGPSNTLAFNYLPISGSDMVLDTSEASFFGNASNNFRRFRNTVAHELGHGLGLEHVVSSTDGLLLEPSISSGFDGPQLDEVRAVHFFYGDVHEKSNDGLGNDTAALATNLGTITVGSPASIGADANVPTQLISATATDFVSISNEDDIDFFSFTTLEPALLDAMLTPLGGIFAQGVETEFDASAKSDLTLTIFDSDSTTLLTTINLGGLGTSESLQDFTLLEPGEYFARVTGADDTIQLYQLDLSVDPVIFLEADFNKDLRVDGLDLAILEGALGGSSAGDANGDDDTDGADFLVWQRQFTGSDPPEPGSLQVVPEPTSAVLLLLGLVSLRRCVALQLL